MPAKIVISKKDMRSFVGLYNRGASLEEVAEQLDVSVPTARRLLVESGATIRPRGRQAKKA